jgi:hypothetical protein
MNESVAESLRPLIGEARATGMWLYSQSLAGILWFSPDELAAENAKGKFCWGPINWQLRHPQEYLRQLRIDHKKYMETYENQMDRLRNAGVV